MHFSLLLVHNLSDGPLGLVVKFIKFFWIVHFCGINLRIANKHSVPNSLFGFLKIKIEVIFSFNVFDLPYRLRCINLLIQFTLNDNVTVLVFHRNMFCLDFYFKLFGLDLGINFERNFNLTNLLTPWILFVFAAIVSVYQVDVGGGWGGLDCCCLWLCLCFWWLIGLGRRFRFRGFRNWLGFLLLNGWCLLRFWLSWIFLLLLLLLIDFKFFVELFDRLFRESLVVLLLELFKNS